MLLKAEGLYVFGSYRLNAHERLLLRDGEPVPLPPRAFDLLLALVAHAGSLATKEELLSEVWAGTFVEEANLSYTVSLLRKALGDEGYIETVPKSGYRFTAPVSVVSAAPAESTSSTDELRGVGGWSGESVPSAPDADAAARGRVPGWRWSKLAAVGLGLAVVGIAAGYFLRPSREGRLTRFDLPPPSGTAWGNALAISPDGRRVAFVAVSGETSSIWIRDLDDTRSRQLDGTNGADVQLFWSPDSISLGFFADGKLKTVSADGGPVLRLADTPVPGGGTWNRDNVIVFSPDETSGLRRVRADGGEAGELKTLGAGTGDAPHRAPVFLPDGRHLLYVTRNGVFATSLDDPGHRVRVLNAPTSVQVVLGRLLFFRDGSLWAQPFDANAMALSGVATRIIADVEPLWARGYLYQYSVSDAGVLVYRRADVQPTRQFVWVDRSGHELSRLPVTGAFDAPALSPDGTRLAFSKESSGNRDIYVLDLEHPAPTKLTFDARNDNAPVWSSDGRRIAFARDNGTAGLFEVAADGQGHEQQLLPPNNLIVFPHSYTRDGRTLLVTRFSAPGGTKGGLFMLSLEGDRKLIEFLDTPTNELQPRLSPDNHWVAYMSFEDGGYQVYVERYPARGAKTQVSNGSNSMFLWSADGGELFYVGRDNHLMAVRMNGGAPMGLPVSLFDLGVSTSFAVAPDGQRFLINAAATGSDAKTIEVVMNWPALLKR